MASFNANHRVLMVGGEGVVLYAPSGRGIERETAISWDVPNFDAQLAEVLAERNRSKSVIVLFDGADQAYRKEENIPKLSAFDRPRFLKRKLELAFPSYPIRAALEIKPPKPKKQPFITLSAPPAVPKSYLFVALPEAESLDRVGEALFESGVPVAGFGLLPVESAGLVSEISSKVFAGSTKKSRWSLLIGQHETGGLRQVVVRDGNLALARLTPATEAGTSGAGWVEDVLRSYKETMAYISRFGYTPKDGLDVVVVCGDIEKQFFDPAQMEATNFHCINPGEALGLIGFKAFGMQKANFADALHAAWAGRKPSLSLPMRVPSIHRVMAPRLGARIAAGLFVVSALGLAAYTFDAYQSYLGIQDELASKQNLFQTMQREYEHESQAFDALPLRPEVLNNVLGVKENLGVNTVDPAPILNRLKDAVGGDIRFDRLSYQHAPSPAFRAGTGGAAGFRPVVADPNDRGRVSVSFSFKLPSGLLLEQKVARAEEVKRSIETAFPNWEVSLVKQFGGVSRTGSFQGVVGGESTASAPQDDAAEFKIEGAP